MAALLKRIKYRIAELLNRSPRTCWTNLVCWVEYGHPLLDCRIDDACRSHAAVCGRCYCGKVGGPKSKETV